MRYGPSSRPKHKTDVFRSGRNVDVRMRHLKKIPNFFSNALMLTPTRVRFLHVNVPDNLGSTHSQILINFEIIL